MEIINKIINLKYRYKYEWLCHLIALLDNYQNLNKIKNDIGAIVCSLFFNNINNVDKIIKEHLTEHVNELDINSLNKLNELTDRVNSLPHIYY